ncbi:RTA1 domain protein [Aspergillus sclerotialis]|uniref:RTA1 domain protein n=1 Tax=Aspergillus sclerotialis TaxID=2070753 RepID=A0A3A2ZPC1_9EURO|nr:RTA1 domain protein [Aspergillus sclerotialis]
MDFTFHPGKNGSDPWVEFYPYTPSQSAGYAFVAIFAILTIAHFALMFPYRAAYFIPLIIGGICETFGYYGRAWSHEDRTEIGPWALQQILILCAPPFIAATIYMVLGRIIRAFDAEHLSSIRTKWLTAIFVINDVICFLTQIVGAGVQVTGDRKLMSIGMKAVLGGLIFALVVFCLFVLVAVVFHRRLARNPTAVLHRNPELAWRRYMWAIYVSCLTMMVRNLVRTIEFGASKESAVNTQEAYIYVFDAAMMAISMAVFVVWHPGRLIRRVRKEDKYTSMADVPLTRYDSPPRP